MHAGIVSAAEECMDACGAHLREAQIDYWSRKFVVHGCWYRVSSGAEA